MWITGASQGLGEVLALYLAAHGAKLILSSRSQDKLEVRPGDACPAAPTASPVAERKSPSVAVTAPA